MFLSWIFLSKFEEVQLHGLGEATRTVAAVAESLQRNVQQSPKRLGLRNDHKDLNPNLRAGIRADSKEG